jgi:hypothetical protein
MAQQLGMAGSSALPNVVYIQERRQKQEVVIIIECTMHVNEHTSVLRDLLDIYHFETLVTSPDEFGFPANRPRKFMIGVLRSYGVLRYPVHHPVHGILKHYKVLCLTGDDLYLAPQAEIEKHNLEVGRAKGLPKELVQVGCADDLLSAGDLVRKDNYIEKMTKARHSQVQLTTKLSLACFA